MRSPVCIGVFEKRLLLVLTALLATTRLQLDAHRDTMSIANVLAGLIPAAR